MSMTSVSPATTSFTLQNISRLAFPHSALWITATAMFAVNAIWIALSPRISIAPDWTTQNLGLIGTAAMLLLLRNFRDATFTGLLHRAWCLFMTALFASVLLNNLMVLNHVLMTIIFPMADDRLMSWDLALGLHWLAYAKYMTSIFVIQKILYAAYMHFTYAGVGLIAVILVCLDKRVRTIELAYLLTSAAVICLVVAVGFPARGTMALLADNELLTRLEFGAGTFFIDQLAETRGQGPLFLDPANLQGLASFPSFHTCLAVIIMRCSRGIWPTTLLGTAVGIAILAATPIYGGHYFVDVLGGGILMLIAVWLWHKQIFPNVKSSIPARA
jgi:PAP2 superfamily